MRFQKRIKIAPGVRLNVSKSGVSTTVGKKGASVNVSDKGVYSNVGLPGTGISHRQRMDGSPETDINDEAIYDGAEPAEEEASEEPIKVQPKALLWFLFLIASVILLFALPPLGIPMLVVFIVITVRMRKKAKLEAAQEQAAAEAEVK